MSRRTFTMTSFPSPVPTGKGLRSSAINDKILSDFLTASVHIPDLKLPASFQSRHILISPVDYRSIVSGDFDAIESVKRSASEFGLFVVSGHGVTTEDAEAVGGDDRREWKRLEAEEEGFDFCWAGDEDEEEGSEINSDMTLDPNLCYPTMTFSNEKSCLERKEGELVAVAKALGKLFQKDVAGFGSTQAKELAVLKCNVDYQLNKSDACLNDEDNGNSALSLYLPSSKCEILVHAGTESFVFQAGPDTIVAILGQQLEVDGNVKHLPRILRFLQPANTQKSSSHPLILSVGLKFCRIIAISDQIIAASLIILLFQLTLWIYKSVQNL